jgi:hypothetical protein
LPRRPQTFGDQALSTCQPAIAGQFRERELEILLLIPHENDRKLVVKWDVDSQKPMKGEAPRQVLELIAALVSEGRL